MKKLIVTMLCSVFWLTNAHMALADELVLPASCYQGSTFIGYTVKDGDSLYKIGLHYGFDAYTLAAINDIIDPRVIEVGQQLKIPATEDVSHEIIAGDSLYSLANLYGMTPMEIAMANDLWDTEVLPVGVSLSIPGLSRAQAVSLQLSARAELPFVLQYPVDGVISSGYGQRSNEFHTGTDIACEYGSEVKAAQSGQVVSADWDGNYGYAVVIDHKNGYKTRYAHNSQLLVEVGDVVAVGQTIALAGSTGRSTGPHVHLEVLKATGGTENPMRFLTKEK